MISSRINKSITGFIAGILLPLIVLFILLMVKKNDYSLFEMISLNQQMGILSKMISLSLIPNLLLFFIFIWTNLLKAGRGVLMSMFLFGFVIIILKIL